MKASLPFLVLKQKYLKASSKAIDAKGKAPAEMPRERGEKSKPTSTFIYHDVPFMRNVDVIQVEFWAPRFTDGPLFSNRELQKTHCELCKQTRYRIQGTVAVLEFSGNRNRYYSPIWWSKILLKRRHKCNAFDPHNTMEWYLRFGEIWEIVVQHDAIRIDAALLLLSDATQFPGDSAVSTHDAIQICHVHRVARPA